jgi:hypothetical protein
MPNDDPTPPADSAAVLQLGIVHPDARIDREDGRSAPGRLQRQAIRAGHLAPRPGNRNLLVVTGPGRAALGRAVLERAAATQRQYRDDPDRFLCDHADDAGLRRALADGTPAAIAAAITRIRNEDAAALARLRAALQS